MALTSGGHKQGGAGGDLVLDPRGKIPWAVREEWPPNPLSFGGVGDGNPANAAADTAAIQACLDLGGVTLPHRHLFTASDRLTVDADEVHITGGGGLGKLQLATGVNKNLFRHNTAVVPTTRRKRLVVRDLYLDHQAQNNGQALAGSGIEACFVVYATDKVIIDNVHLANPLGVGFDVRACKYVRIRDPFIENLIHSGSAANAINVGAHAAAGSGGEDYVIDGAEIIGGGDVAIWLSGWGARRLECTRAHVRGDTQRVIADAEVVAGSLNILHSESADFTTADIGKLVYLINAGVRTGLFRIVGIVDEAHATLSGNATAMAGATAAIRIQNSGVLCEGGNNADDGQAILTENQVESTWNVGLGFSDAGGAGTLKHQKSIAAFNQVINAQPGSTAMWGVGRHLSFVKNIIDAYQGQGLVFGAGPDFDAYGLEAIANSIEAAAAATGSALRVFQNGAYANFLHDVLLAHNLLIGNGAVAPGLELLGKLKDIELPVNRIRGWGRSGLITDISGGSAPVGVRIRGGYSKNNNQAGGADLTNLSAGYAFNRGSDLYLEDATASDDQDVKTQRRGVYQNAAATPLYVRRNDLRGNLNGPINVEQQNANDVYEGNRDVDGQYEGGATLVNGQVVVNTAAIAGNRRIELTHETFVNPGGLFIGARVNGTSFTIKSTSGTDGSLVRWRIR